MNESVKIPTNNVESKVLSSLVFIDESGYCWKGNLARLKSFVQNDLKLIGKWSLPGGETKLFKNTEIILKWTGQTRKKLIIEKDSEVNLVANMLKSLCNGDVVCLDTATACKESIDNKAKQSVAADSEFSTIWAAKKAIPETQAHNRLPTFFHSNIRSLNAKIDDLQTVTQQNNVDVIAITETWLNSRITDGPISFLGYSIVRNDRENGKRGRGVCAFIKSNIPFSTLPNLSAPDVVGVWLKLRPYQLPRKLSCIFIGMIYHRPLADNNILQDYLISMVDNLLLDHPNTGIMILGDFNHFHYKTLCHHSFLKQTVKKTYPANSHFRFDLNQYAQMVQRTRNLTSVKYHCIFCREMEHKIESQFMSDLPQLRLAPCTPPFHHTV